MTSPASSGASSSAPAAPVITRSEATWRGDRSFDAGPEGRTHRIDVNAKEAPGPVETLLNALATCSGVDIIDILAKRKTPVERMNIQVAAERRPEAPRRVMKVDLEYRIEGAGIEAEHAERAIQLSFERYCSVAASLAADIVAHTKLVLNGETFDSVERHIWRP